MSDKIAIIGYSGHGLVVAETAIFAGIPLSYYCEKKITNRNPFQLAYLGFEESSDFRGWQEKYQFILGIGDNKIRNRAGINILDHGNELINVIHPSASISKSITIGTGNFISRQAVVNTLAEIGNFCILNSSCIVEHECKLGNGVHIAPGAVLSGNVHIGNNSFIGANAVVKQGVRIGTNVIIGAGSVIIKDIADNQTIVGNPGRII
ncbi:acetyltransferase [Albibacterium sp.]|uniref:acetyltransferase n=1 Tax=Albibacterium sp. TaxID=2952885 RepID=UPI002C3B5D02|nr:acetyltransferase [Albibacterium sp.]HUH18931.1 acetyltransferase [Albibacterium sp.]